MQNACLLEAGLEYSRSSLVSEMPNILFLECFIAGYIAWNYVFLMGEKLIILCFREKSVKYGVILVFCHMQSPNFVQGYVRLSVTLFEKFPHLLCSAMNDDNSHIQRVPRRRNHFFGYSLSFLTIAYCFIHCFI